MQSLSNGQKSFLEKVLNGENVFLTGKAGTGKSFVTKKAIKSLQEQGKKVIALAPTGIAANNIGGQTIHSMFSLNPFGVMDFKSCNFLKGEKRRLFEAIDVIFIDEVSMLRADLLDGINWTLIKNGCNSLLSKQLVFIGDMKQLEAPIDDNMLSVMLRSYEGVEFYNAHIYDKLNVQNIELDEVKRQNNDEFIHHLNIIREGGKSEYFKKFVGDQRKGIVLAPHNTTVAKYNEEGYSLMEGDEYVFKAKITGDVKITDFNLEPVVRIKDGCKVMYLANSKSHNNLVNGTLGTFRVIDDNFFIEVNQVKYALSEVKFTKKEYVLNEKQNALQLVEIGSIEQYPIKLAYALTIHKSQGLTFDEVTVDLSRPCFSKGQMYVALSRVTGPEGLTIIVNR